MPSQVTREQLINHKRAIISAATKHIDDPVKILALQKAAAGISRLADDFAAHEKGTAGRCLLGGLGFAVALIGIMFWIASCFLPHLQIAGGCLTAAGVVMAAVAAWTEIGSYKNRLNKIGDDLRAVGIISIPQPPVSLECSSFFDPFGKRNRRTAGYEMV